MATVIDIEDCGGPAPPLEDADAARVAELQTALTAWFQRVRRLLPWRGDVFTPGATPVAGAGPLRDAYGTWVSEVMLQQTRVETVIDFWLRWMAKYPTVAALAAASEADVFASWSGLGFYRRASNLLKGAKFVVDEFKGVVPRGVSDLKRIPGIGDYTAGAIASISFGDAEALVDGNVIRVMCRLMRWPLDPKAPATAKKVWPLARRLVTGSTAPGDYNQGLMELGATVCTPAGPSCGACPLRHAGLCGAWEEGLRVYRAGGVEALAAATAPAGEDVAAGASAAAGAAAGLGGEEDATTTTTTSTSSSAGKKKGAASSTAGKGKAAAAGAAAGGKTSSTGSGKQATLFQFGAKSTPTTNTGSNSSSVAATDTGSATDPAAAGAASSSAGGTAGSSGSTQAVPPPVPVDVPPAAVEAIGRYIAAKYPAKAAKKPVPTERVVVLVVEADARGATTDASDAGSVVKHVLMCKEPTDAAGTGSAAGGGVKAAPQAAAAAAAAASAGDGDDVVLVVDGDDDEGEGEGEGAAGGKRVTAAGAGSAASPLPSKGKGAVSGTKRKRAAADTAAATGIAGSSGSKLLQGHWHPPCQSLGRVAAGAADGGEDDDHDAADAGDGGTTGAGKVAAAANRGGAAAAKAPAPKKRRGSAGGGAAAAAASSDAALEPLEVAATIARLQLGWQLEFPAGTSSLQATSGASSSSSGVRPVCVLRATVHPPTSHVFSHVIHELHVVALTIEPAPAASSAAAVGAGVEARLRALLPGGSAGAASSGAGPVVEAATGTVRQWFAVGELEAAGMTSWTTRVLHRAWAGEAARVLRPAASGAVASGGVVAASEAAGWKALLARWKKAGLALP